MRNILRYGSLSGGVYPSASRRPSLLTALLTGALALSAPLSRPAAAGDARSVPPPAHTVRLDPDQPVWVDVARRRVAVDGRICLREGVLEMFACPAQTKEHESVVAVDSSGFLLHTALLAAGAEPGKPARFEPKFQPPEGPEIEVSVEWVDKSGKPQAARAQSWIRNSETGEEMQMPFVFGGSGFWVDPDSGRQRYLADSGDLICVSNFGTAMLDVPVESTQSNEALLFEPFTERIPPLDTPVRVWLTVKTKPTRAEPAAPGDGVRVAIAALQGVVDGGGAGDDQRTAWKTLAEASPAELPEMLRSLGDGSAASQNWIRTAIDAASARMEAHGELPMADLLAFVRNVSEPPRGRRVAYEILTAADPTRVDELLGGFLDDPSLELRYDAVQAILDRAESGDELRQRELFARALGAGRHLPQIEAAAKGLESLGEKVDLVTTLGFITDWRLVGPFDNRKGIGFGEAYPPETELVADRLYDGMPDEDAGVARRVGWNTHHTDDRLGEVDVNGAVGPHKGAVAYAWATVLSDKPRDAQLRYTSRNATKVWVNGRLVAENEVYHSGSGFDQFRADATLRAGENQILIKVCQNEQSQPWAQGWNYGLRVCDRLGGAIDGVEAINIEGERP